MWTYIECFLGEDRHTYSVGFYDFEGEWTEDSSWKDKTDAVKRCIHLNGGPDPEVGAALIQLVRNFEEANKTLKRICNELEFLGETKYRQGIDHDK